MRTRGDRIKVGVGCVLAAAIVLGVWQLLHKSHHQEALAGGPAAGTPSQHRLQPTDARSRGTSKAGRPNEVGPPAAASYKAALQNTRDYWEYARRILPAAKAGDRDAQFYLSRVMERCQSDSRMFLQQQGRPLTEEESLQLAATRNLPIDLAQQAYERCHSFQENGTGELGNATEWLGRATLAGQPVAQVTTATRILLRRSTDRLAKAAGVAPAAVIAVSPDTAGMDPQELLREAVESDDPEVLFQIGAADALLHPSIGGDDNTERYAWWLVACERGLDCSPSADWVKNVCYLDPQCASIGPSEIVEYLAGADWPKVQQRAEELKTKLDAGQWDDLGLKGKG